MHWLSDLNCPAVTKRKQTPKRERKSESKPCKKRKRKLREKNGFSHGTCTRHEEKGKRKKKEREREKQERNETKDERKETIRNSCPRKRLALKTGRFLVEVLRTGGVSGSQR